MNDAATESIVSYYVERLIVQYKRLPRARATVAAYVRQIVADLILKKIETAFDIDTATGAQLDIIAKYVGTSRNFNVSGIEGNYFGFKDYDPEGVQNPNGFRDYTDPAINAGADFLRYDSRRTSTYALTDNQLRIAIKLKITTNTSDGTLAHIVESLWSIFGKAITLTDNADMTITYTVATGSVDLPETALAILLPRPAAVGINIDFVENDTFRFTRYTAATTVLAGFRRYSGPPTGVRTITYQNP